jgi:hypothetical protein
LQVANAAYNAGFNTLDHVRLFNLIWAVKQEALKARIPERPPPPPPHPIYPDRYRPSGIGDNARSKRKRPEDVELKFDSVPSLMQKGGTKDNPISLDEDDDRSKALPRAPKAICRTLATKDNPIDLETGEIAANHGSKQLQSLTEPFGPANKKVKSNQGKALAVPRANPVMREIMKVKNKLEQVRLDVNGCQASMKTLFDKNRGTFNDDEIMAVLQKLADAMNKAYDGAADGGKIAEKAAATLTFGGPVF